MWFALGLSLVVVAYNNVVNRWGPFHHAAYVPLNLAFAGTVTFVAAASLGLSRDELGLRGDPGDAALPLILISIFAVGSFTLVRSRHAHHIADKRFSDMNVGELAFYTLIRIPLGTAVAEEIVFRGALFAAWLDAGLSMLAAAVCASIAFGLWHVTPTVLGVRINDPAASRRKLSVAVIGGVVFTTAAGLGLTWLRMYSGGLVGPIVLHAGINSVGALTALWAGRQSLPSNPAP